MVVALMVERDDFEVLVSEESEGDGREGVHRVNIFVLSQRERGLAFTMRIIPEEGEGKRKCWETAIEESFLVLSQLDQRSLDIV